MDRLSNIAKELDEVLISAREATPFEESLCGTFLFGGCSINFCFDPDGCELDIYNPAKGTFLVNIAEHLERGAIAWNDIKIEGEYDLWDDHGFSDEADYLRYRYG